MDWYKMINLVDLGNELDNECSYREVRSPYLYLYRTFFSPPNLIYSFEAFRAAPDLTHPILYTVPASWYILMV